VKCFLGIDLGSTTTKAVVLDAGERVLGRGITNSRSNYDVACAVARSEAFLAARLGLVERELTRALPEAEAAQARPHLEAALRRAQYRIQLARLGQVVLSEAHEPRHAACGAELPALLEAMFTTLDAQADALFEPGHPRKSDFFRDLAAAEYLRLAEERARPAGITFDRLIGLFDRAILVVENETQDVPFTEHALAALHELQERGRASRGAVDLERRVRTAAATEFEVVQSVGTGYGRQRLPFPKAQIRSEILCHGLGAHAVFPRTATVLDIGGQDTKAIQVDERGIVTSFQMNDRCAAGCGRYLGYIADEMNLGLHELGPLAQQSRRPARINSTCTVFAGAELRDRLTAGEKREDVLAGLHRAVILRSMSLLARSGGIRDEFTFTGGVARNPAACDALLELVRENYGERTVNLSADSIYMGALGAALYARRDALETAVAS
jgi:benzoyl-CoA reductase subunit A